MTRSNSQAKNSNVAIQAIAQAALAAEEARLTPRQVEEISQMARQLAATELLDPDLLLRMLVRMYGAREEIGTPA